MEAIRNAGLRVCLDPMYGVSQTSLQTILSTARCYMETIHERHDTLFGGKLPAPNAETLRGLQNYVVDYGYDIGVATDGDADRIGVIDDRGRFMHPNDILVTIYYYLLKYKGWKGPAVRNISTTHKLDRVAKSFGEACYEVPVGFKYISAKMDETDALIGGESSGGLTVRGHIHGKDGVYAASLLVEMIAVTGKKLSDIYTEIEDKFGRDYMEERAYQLTPERKEELQEILFTEKKIPENLKPFDRVSYPDGLKVYYQNGGWISARFSGTEPLLRIFSEMPDKEEAAGECDKFEKLLGISAHSLM
jgi:phosphomannomutase